MLCPEWPSSPAPQLASFNIRLPTHLQHHLCWRSFEFPTWSSGKNQFQSRAGSLYFVASPLKTVALPQRLHSFCASQLPDACPYKMFNRSNLPSVPNPFGARPEGGRPSQQGYSNPNQAPPRYDNSHGPVPSAGHTRDYDVTMTDASTFPRGYGAPPPPGGRPLPPMPPRPPVGGRPGAGPTWMLHPSKSPNDNYTFGNL